MKKLCISAIAILVLLCYHCFGTEPKKNQPTTKKETSVSYYHDKFNGRKTASGEVFDQKKLTAASNNYLLGTILRITRVLGNDTLTVDVRVNDRIHTKYANRIDLSKSAMKKIDGVKKGVLKVKVEVVDGFGTNML